MTASNQNQLIQIKGNLSSVGWIAPADLTQDEWQNIGGKIKQTNKMISWVIGDWLNACPDKSDESLKEASDLVGISFDRLRFLRNVSKSVSPDRRRSGLSHKTHSEVAIYHNDPDKQAHWLDLAEKHNWSARLLSEAIKQDKKPKYTCVTCGLIFDKEYWHCDGCGGHWTSGQNCINCSEENQPETKLESGLTHKEQEILFDKMESIMNKVSIRPTIETASKDEPDIPLAVVKEKEKDCPDSPKSLPTETVVIFEKPKEPEENLDTEIKSVMKRGGEMLCDDIIAKWQGDYYGHLSQDEKTKQRLKWGRVKRGIGEMIKRI